LDNESLIPLKYKVGLEITEVFRTEEQSDGFEIHQCTHLLLLASEAPRGLMSTARSPERSDEAPRGLKSTARSPGLPAEHEEDMYVCLMLEKNKFRNLGFADYVKINDLKDFYPDLEGIESDD
jgi:hypothetical protein